MEYKKQANKKTKLMSKPNQQKQTRRYREQTSGYQRGEEDRGRAEWVKGIICMG